MLRSSMTIFSTMTRKEKKTHFQAQHMKAVNEKSVGLIKIDVLYDKFLEIKIGEYAEVKCTNI